MRTGTTYLTPLKLADVVGRARLIAAAPGPAQPPTTWDAARVQQALDDVADQIDARIRRRYCIPLDDVPGFLARAAGWCALGALVDECTITDLIAERAKEGWQVVSDIAAGKLRIGGNLDDDPGANQPTRAGRAVMVAGPDTPFSRTRLRGII